MKEKDKKAETEKSKGVLQAIVKMSLYIVCLVFRSRIKFSFSIRHCRIIFVSFFVMISLSIIMNFTCLLKLWLFSWKFLHANMVLGLGFFTSFLYIISCIPSNTWLYMTILLTLKVNVVMTWLQQRDLLFPKHGIIYLASKCFSLLFL